MDPVDEFLEHFGVRGMHWGVRNNRPGDADTKLKKGTKVYNVSGGTKRSNKGPVYGAHKTRDIVNYRGKYAGNLKYIPEFNKLVFSNQFTVKGDMKVAGRKTQVDAFKDLWSKDKEGMVNALADAQKNMKFAAAFNAKVLHLDRTNVYHDRMMKKGERWISSTGVQEFNSALGTKIGGKKMARGRALYFKEMQKRGYDAVADLNDIKNYGSEEPILVLNGKRSLTTPVSVKLTDHDIQKAGEAYFSNKKLKEYEDTIHKAA